MQQSSQGHVTVTTVFALATLGGVTTNRNDPISVALPKVEKASISVLLSHAIVASIIAQTFADVNTALDWLDSQFKQGILKGEVSLYR